MISRWLGRGTGGRYFSRSQAPACERILSFESEMECTFILASFFRRFIPSKISIHILFFESNLVLEYSIVLMIALSYGRKQDKKMKVVLVY